MKLERKVASLLGAACTVTFIVALNLSAISPTLWSHDRQFLRTRKLASTGSPAAAPEFEALLPHRIQQELVIDEQYAGMDVITAQHTAPSPLPANLSFLPPQHFKVFRSWDEPAVVDVRDDSDWWPGKRPPQLPRNFDWRQYLMLNGDVAGNVLSTPRGSASHWISCGFHEGRVYSRLRVKLRYQSCPPADVVSQHYAHLSAAMLATALGSDLILPHSWTRAPGLAGGGAVQWRPDRFEALWDAEYIHALWQGQHQNFTPHDEVVWKLDPARVVQIELNETGPTPVSRLAEQIKRQVVALAGQVYDQVDAYAKAYYPTLALLPCPLLLVQSDGEGLATRIARHLRFNPALQDLADGIVRVLLHQSPGGFNGLHLLPELNETAGTLQLHSESAPFWHRLFEAADQANLTQSHVPLYVVSDLLSTNCPKMRRQVCERLSQVSSTIAHAGLFLSPAQLAALSHEQRSVVDLLVLSRALRFVGAAESQLSTFVREYRHIMGLADRSTTTLTPPPAAQAPSVKQRQKGLLLPA